LREREIVKREKEATRERMAMKQKVDIVVRKELEELTS
jgi:hypothetical protein